MWIRALILACLVGFLGYLAWTEKNDGEAPEEARRRDSTPVRRRRRRGLGLGPSPPNPSWGSLISDGFDYIRTSPYLLIFPGIVLSLTLLAINFLGDGLRDAFDPQSEKH